MQIDERHFRNILTDLIQESPLACRGLLAICRIEFTGTVDTLCVTLTAPPRLRVNLDFLRQYCRTEQHVKTVLVHEFLHVLLRHTARFRKMTPLLNIALDAIINAIIHRKLGAAYSEFLSRFYQKATDLVRLLRPPETADYPSGNISNAEEEFFGIWRAVYGGQLVADDVYDLCRALAAQGLATPLRGGIIFLGNHGADALDVEEIWPEFGHLLRDTLRQLDGHGIWKHSSKAGEVDCRASAENADLERWRRSAWRVLKEAIVPDRTAQTIHPFSYSLPVLNEHDRRAFLRALWNPLPGAVSWRGERRIPQGSVQIYLDVSGSMEEPMCRILQLLVHFLRWIRQPFWAFSDRVEPARITNGRLVTRTTVGTSIDAVLEHVLAFRPRKAVLVTDGYVGRPDRALLKRLPPATLQAIITNPGQVERLADAGIACCQLDILPEPGRAGSS